MAKVSSNLSSENSIFCENLPALFLHDKISDQPSERQLKESVTQKKIQKEKVVQVV